MILRGNQLFVASAGPRLTVFNVSDDKNQKLEESLQTVKTQITDLKESSSADRQLSDKALVISNETFKVKEASDKLNENHAVHSNQWINQGVLDKLNNK